MANNVPYRNHYQYGYYNNGLNYNNYHQYYPSYQNYHVNYPMNGNYSTSNNYIPNNNFPWANNYNNSVQYNNKYKKNNKYVPKTFDCGVCNLFFKNNWQLQEHISDTHIKCNHEDCSFNGPLEILEIHKLKHIKNENGESLIDSKEETMKWINSRKSKFPRSNSPNSISNDPNDKTIDKVAGSTSQEAPKSGKNTANLGKDVLNTRNEDPHTSDPSGISKVENVDKIEQSMLEIYLRNNMKNKTVSKRTKKSIICPLLNKIYKQPSALIRYTNPYKYENLLRRMDALNTPYSFNSSIIEKKQYNKKYTIYSIPKRPPAYLELIRSDVERLDSLVVEAIRAIQYLKSNEKCVNIKRYAGCVAAVDAMCWIHRSMVSSAVANVRGEMSDKFLKFIISMLSLLLSYNITPIMVFDGYEMPAKKAENMMRRERREKAKKEALEMIAKNKNKINTEIMKKCMQAIHITPEIIYRVISVCKKINVAVIVSPFEADAQVSYLCRSGIADIAISEDSDLVVYGCPKIIYKLDKEGKGVELNVPFNAFKAAPGPKKRKEVKFEKPEERSGEESMDLDSKDEEEKHTNKSDYAEKDARIFKGLNHRMFVVMCVLSGTDYDDGYHINGMGLKVAYRLILEHERLEGVLKSVYEDAKWSSKLAEYKFEDILLHYENVCKIFLHNIVFDPKKHQLIHINPISNLDNMSTNKLELLKEEVGEYKFIYDMSAFLINKNVNFINVAKGLISVADDMEIDYVLTEYDLKAIEAVTNKIKFDLYRLPDTPAKARNVGASALAAYREGNVSPSRKSAVSRSPSLKSRSGSATPKSSSRSPSVKSEGSKSSKSGRKRSRNVSPSKLGKKGSRYADKSDRSPRNPGYKSPGKSSDKSNTSPRNPGDGSPNKPFDKSNKSPSKPGHRSPSKHADKFQTKSSPKSHGRTGGKPTHSPTAKTASRPQDKGTVVTAAADNARVTTASGKLAADILENHVVNAEASSKKFDAGSKIIFKTSDKLKHTKHSFADGTMKLKNENKRLLNSKGVVQNLLNGTETYTVKRARN
ncbi:uncharacterized protein TOT_040000754 [Theileria orientalis strain Shintoku]|uniref:Exonuclease 1 n=1 Tax=Theileria orientalis strain Shintoku TaxID=869250 RepID=J7MCA4_THEOR|nr:uncharacterized protein TOT_040000754 [Theileria orientalis strain Shintoku]BAM42387.1 uncharacterized protein TOT_040000754 [Theileria orientalis strain Shintoku]|eukprot:XP_009692688.1 uncharacterized protein TOT_040000754 [Theileria orientalis strain Shintoku]